MSTARPEAEPAEIFAALGDGTRLLLLEKLSGGPPLSIAKLSAGTDLTRQAITKHLHVLENAGLVTSERIGRESLYSFAPAALAGARTYIDAVSIQWDDALSRLTAFVED